MQHIKNFLKRFLPPPVKVFNREVDRILDTTKEAQRAIEQKISEKGRADETDKKIKAAMTELRIAMEAKIDAAVAELSSLQNDVIITMTDERRMLADLLNAQPHTSIKDYQKKHSDESMV
jgi:hypothetical protein